MKRIVFLCHGNICRSPMVEFVMKKLVKEAGREKEFAAADLIIIMDESNRRVHSHAQSH